MTELEEYYKIENNAYDRGRKEALEKLKTQIENEWLLEPMNRISMAYNDALKRVLEILVENYGKQ